MMTCTKQLWDQTPKPEGQVSSVGLEYLSALTLSVRHRVTPKQTARSFGVWPVVGMCDMPLVMLGGRVANSRTVSLKSRLMTYFSAACGRRFSEPGRTSMKSLLGLIQRSGGVASAVPPHLGGTGWQCA